MAKIKKPAIIIGMIFIVIVFIILVKVWINLQVNSSYRSNNSAQSTSKSQSESYQPNSGDCQLVKSLEESGLITKMRDNEIQISGYLWNFQTSLDDKRNIVYMLHVCYRPTFKLIDNKTGKIYGRYDSINGIVIE
mgnify:CR=1 FL=1